MRLFGAQMPHAAKVHRFREKSHTSKAVINWDILAGSRLQPRMAPRRPHAFIHWPYACAPATATAPATKAIA